MATGGVWGQTASRYRLDVVWGLWGLVLLGHYDSLDVKIVRTGMCFAELTGCTARRYAGKLFHLGIGRGYAGQEVTMVITAVLTEKGGVIGELVSDISVTTGNCSLDREPNEYETGGIRFSLNPPVCPSCPDSYCQV